MERVREGVPLEVREDEAVGIGDTLEVGVCDDDCVPDAVLLTEPELDPELETLWLGLALGLVDIVAVRDKERDAERDCVWVVLRDLDLDGVGTCVTLGDRVREGVGLIDGVAPWLTDIDALADTETEGDRDALKLELPDVLQEAVDV